MKNYYLYVEAHGEDKEIAVEVRATDFEEAKKYAARAVSLWEHMYQEAEEMDSEAREADEDSECYFKPQGVVGNLERDNLNRGFKMNLGALHEGCECVLVENFESKKAYHYVGTWEEVDNYLEEDEFEKMVAWFKEQCGEIEL